MRLVVDTSIIFSLFKPASFTTKLLKEYNIWLFAPENLVKELLKYSKLICSKSGISEEKFLKDLELLPELVNLKNSSQSFKNKAVKLISHKEDAPFLALALELNIPIWSNDEHFKEQSEVKVFTTEELKEFLDAT